MYPTIKAYKTEQKQFYREKSYVFVYLGVITKEAQASAYVSSEITDFSIQLENILAESSVEGYYGTLEENFYKADGTMVNIPRDGSLFGIYQGAVSEDLIGGITFMFNGYEHLNIKGLTIDFGEYYPTRFTVTNGHQTYTYTNSSSGIFVCQTFGNNGDVFNDTSYITITPLSMIGGRQRLRIMSIMFGVGLAFDNKTLLSTNRKNVIAHISDKLPSKSFSFSISNIDKRFAKDDPKSSINFLEEGQEVEFEYGRDLDDGNGGYYIYRIPGGVVALKNWSSNDSEAKFTAVGFLDYYSGTYYKGQFYPDGIPLYDLAEAVLKDAGIKRYKIDLYLRRVLTRNPLPIDSHKACLQLIANAAQSILYEDRYGNVVIESSFVPEVTRVTANNYTDYSDLTSIVKDVKITSFFTMEQNYSEVNEGDQRYIQREYEPNNYWTDYGGHILNHDGRLISTERNDNLITDQQAEKLYTGYVSEVVSDANGEFSSNPIITIDFEAQWTFFNVHITYAYVTPKTVTIKGYIGDVLVNTYEYMAESYFDLQQTYEGEFNEINRITIEFVEARPHQRIHVAHVAFGDVTDYTIRYTDMPDSPTASSIDKVKNVDVKYYDYNTYESDTFDKVVTIQATEGQNTATFKNDFFGYALSYVKNKDGSIPTGELEIIESGAHYIVFTSSIAAPVDINGHKFNITENIYSKQINETGIAKTVSNELINTLDEAIKEADWCGEYFRNDVEYSLKYRGEPALDCDDIIYLQNKYVNKNKVRVEEETIDTSTGMSFSCSVKARRISYEE